MFRTLAISAAAAGFVAAPVFAGSMAPPAADPVPYTPAPVVMDNGWTGPYGGIQLGYGSMDLGGAGDEGWIYGAQLGYDYQMGNNFVVGAELDWVGSDMSFGGTDLDSLQHAKLRAGYGMGDALVYATGGVARADTTIGDDLGWAIGGGVEYKVTPNIGLGAEYLYNKFDDFNGTGNDLDGSTVAMRVNFRF